MTKKTGYTRRPYQTHLGLFWDLTPELILSNKSTLRNLHVHPVTLHSVPSSTSDYF